jgi:hypothetical protein
MPEYVERNPGCDTGTSPLIVQRGTLIPAASLRALLVELADID